VVRLIQTQRLKTNSKPVANVKRSPQVLELIFSGAGLRPAPLFLDWEGSILKASLCEAFLFKLNFIGMVRDKL